MTGPGRAGDGDDGAAGEPGELGEHDRAGDYLDGVLGPEHEAAFLDHLAGCLECQTALHDEVQLRDREAALREREAAAGCHARVSDYLDGRLASEDELAFLGHLAGCLECQAALHDEVQLRDREDDLRQPAKPPADGIADQRAPNNTDGRPSRPRGRLAAWGAGVAALAAAAAIALRPPERPPVVLATRTTRAAEIRLSHPAAAPYRPYDTVLGSPSPGEPVSPAAIAKLDAAGDCQGVAAAYVVSGELVRAHERYQQCAGGPDLDADRAGLAVLRREFDVALELTERALDTAPRHTVALWNRALALHGLGLDLAAAASFEQVADLDVLRDPGWAREAAERARALSGEIARVRAAYEAVTRLGIAMVGGGPPLPPALARQVPWRSRLYLHDAIRTATTAARLDELAPLAAALNGRAGDDLVRYVTRARAQLSPARAAASAGYRAIFDRMGAVDDPGWTRWLALATTAHDDDLILGARIVTRRLDGDRSAEQLAAATGDPWFELAVAMARAQVALKADRLDDATTRLTALQTQCPASAVSYRCLQLAVELSRLALQRHQPSEAKRHALAALAMSRQLGEWPQRGQALVFAAEAERFGGAFGPALAYYDESSRSLDQCGQHNTAFTSAEMLFQRHHLSRAQAQAVQAPVCDHPASPNELTVLVRLLRSGHAALDRPAVAARIAQAQRAPEIESDALYFDYLAAWLALDVDPAARAQLAHVAERARGLEGAMRDKILTSVASALFADAGQRAAWSDALAVAARAHGVAPPARCALAFGADDFRFAAVVVGPDGTVTGRYAPDQERATSWLAPDAMRGQLAACDDVAVLALPPWLGIGPVLDAGIPWHYVLGPPRPEPRSGARRVVIAEPATPEADLPSLSPRAWPATDGPDELITGTSATPERVLTAIADATLVEIHSHATWRDSLDAPVLALAPGASGWTLDAARIRSARLTGAPVVLLADCAGGAVARFEHQAWGLPLAFRDAGASAVIASLTEIPDSGAVAFFDAVTAELRRGTSPAVAVARIKAEKIAADRSSWVRDVVVFQ